jgi:glutamine synthetase
MSVNLANWIAEHKIDEVECIVPDINGVQRGKVLAREEIPVLCPR